MTVMKRILLPVFVAASVALAGQDLAPVIKSVQEKYAPDKRTALFSVEAIKTNGPVVLNGETNIPQAKAELLEKAAKSDVEIIDAINVLPDEKGLEGKTYGVVSISVATLRYGPSYASEQASQLLMGTPVRMLKKSGWYLVQTPENYIAWVSASGITPMTKQQYNEYVSAKKVIYLPEYGFAYSKPDVKSERVSDVVAGNMFKYEGTKGKFAKVSFADGREAYIPKSEVTDFSAWAKNTRPTEESIIKTAYRFMGVPYLWAGTSSKMLDCSGFSKTVYLLNGLILARDASQQCLTGQNIDVSEGYKNLRPGDLVFFGNRKADGSPNRVWHVGIYVGDGIFIHEAGKVHLTSFNPEHKDIYSKYYVDILVRATRIIGTEDKGMGVTSVENNPYFALQQ